ncbi:hypothetical protein J7E83_13715 [Arthrobacter sp. ISL-48]|uniref:hypothetical protein n=1 Tax=Arthrobacter sp. ISL-48 TaxID=2819110 RepID=UPI001BE5281C|nr:hypothetical protein [Arthrobacter sp. ISL-48]MBT2533160.1 hypothetical protein [Arthrobacter sp. ISL-48]
MKKFFASVPAVLFAGMMIASCGPSTGAPNLRQTSPTSSSECAQFVSEAPCGKYASTAGSDDDKPISWLTAGEVTAQLSKRDGGTYLTVVMPCGPLDAVVTIKGNTMRLTGQRALGASGCEEGKGERRDWVLAFLEGDVGLGYSSNTLTWTNGKDSISFVTL